MNSSLAQLSPGEVPTERELAEIEARELELLRADTQAETFHDFVARMTPRYQRVPKHLRRLYHLIEQTRYRQVFARIVMPPRHGKSETLSHALAWRAKYDPSCLNFYVTFGDQLANQTMRKTLRIGTRAGVNFAQDAKNLHEWRVANYDGGVLGTTVGGQITGRGCNGGIVIGDDLIKGRKAAESRLQRDVVWDFLTDDMMSRLEFGASLFIVGTRWHEDDPHGRLQKKNFGLPWETIILPAVHDGNYRAVDDREHPNPVALWPEAGYDLAWARTVRARGEYGWWSLYEGEPRARGNKLFNEPARYVLPRFGTPEFAALVRGKRLVIGCDCAGTEKTYSDWSAYVVLLLSGYAERTQAWILYAEKMQLSTGKVADVFLRAQRKWWGGLLAVEVNGVGRGVADQVRDPRGQAALLRSVNSRIRMAEVTRTRDKYMESQGLSAAWNAQRVHVPLEADWDVDDFIGQYRDFTGVDDPEDDLVDAGVNGWNFLYSEVPLGDNYRTEEADEF